MEFTQIKDLKSISKNVNLVFIVLEVIQRPAPAKDGHEVRTCKVADRSACINFVLLGELGAHIQPGDICKLTKAYVSPWDGGLALHMGKNGELVKTGDFCMIFNENLNMSEINKIVKPTTTTQNSTIVITPNLPPTGNVNNNANQQVIDLDAGG